MKCASPCFYLKSENSDERCYNFLDSRVRVVATILSIVASLLIIIGAIAAVVLFGSQLGLLYSTIIIGLSVAIGVLLFSASFRCFTCCALVSRFQHSSSRLRIDDPVSDETTENIERHLRDVISEYAESRDAYQDLMNQKEQSAIGLHAARAAYESADAEYQRLAEQPAVDGNISLECQAGLMTSREKCLEYIQTVHAYEGILEQISSMNNLLEFQKVTSAYEQVGVVLRQKAEDAQARERVLESQLDLRTKDFERLSQLERDLRSSIGELENARGAERHRDLNVTSLDVVDMTLEENTFNLVVSDDDFQDAGDSFLDPQNE